MNNYAPNYNQPQQYQQPQPYQQPYQGQPAQNRSYQQSQQPAPQQYPNQNQNNQKVFWSDFHGIKRDNDLYSAVICTDGFFEKAAFREVETAHGPSFVANINLTAIVNDEAVRYYFGEEYIRPDHKVFFHISYWNGLAETIQRANYQTGDKLSVIFDHCELNSFTKDDGSVLYSVNCSGGDLPRKRKSKKNDSEQGSSQGQQRGGYRNNQRQGGGYQQKPYQGQPAQNRSQQPQNRGQYQNQGQQFQNQMPPQNQMQQAPQQYQRQPQQAPQHYQGNPNYGNQYGNVPQQSAPQQNQMQPQYPQPAPVQPNPQDMFIPIDSLGSPDTLNEANGFYQMA